MAAYAAMICAVTGHNEHFVLWEMPVAKGLHYQAVYLLMNGKKVEAANSPEVKIAESVLRQLGIFDAATDI